MLALFHCDPCTVSDCLLLNVMLCNINIGNIIINTPCLQPAMQQNRTLLYFSQYRNTYCCM